MDYALSFSMLLWRSAGSGLLLLPIAVFFGPCTRIRAALEQMAFGVFARATYLACYPHCV